MRTIRTLLVGLSLLAALLGLAPRTEAGTGPYHTVWAQVPPPLDGDAATGGWAAVPPVFETAYVSIYCQNDQTYLYFLVDVTGDTGNDPIGSGDLLWLAFDVDRDGVIDGGTDVLFSSESAILMGKRFFPISPSLPPLEADSTTYSHLAAGFGPTFKSAVPHRFWEAAIRLEEINAFPENTLKFGFRVKSINPLANVKYPADFETSFTALYSIHLWSPEIGYIYRDADPSAAIFRVALLNYGFRVTLIDLNNGLAGVDLKPYSALIVGYQTGSADTWGNAADRQALLASGKPVIAIGYAAKALYTALGLQMGASIHSDNLQETITIGPSLHPAWFSPRRVGISGGELQVVTIDIDHFDFATNAAASPGLIRMGQVGASGHYPLAAESLNGQCFTFWGWWDNPSFWLPDGRQLFANLLAQPPCQPRVLYVAKSNAEPGGLAGAVNLFNQAGIYSQTIYCTTLAASGVPAGAERVVIDDLAGFSGDFCGSQAAVDKIRQSGLPVVGMGAGGSALFGKLGLKIGNPVNTIHTTGLRNLFFSVDPSGQALQRPYNPLIKSTRLQEIYTVAADVTELTLTTPDPSIRTWGRNEGTLFFPDRYAYVTERRMNHCFVLWGGHNSPTNMTTAGSTLFLNAIIDPPCGVDWLIFAPAVFR